MREQRLAQVQINQSILYQTSQAIVCYRASVRQCAQEECWINSGLLYCKQLKGRQDGLQQLRRKGGVRNEGWCEE